MAEDVEPLKQESLALSEPSAPTASPHSAHLWRQLEDLKEENLALKQEAGKYQTQIHAPTAMQKGAELFDPIASIAPDIAYKLAQAKANASDKAFREPRRYLLSSSETMVEVGSSMIEAHHPKVPTTDN